MGTTDLSLAKPYGNPLRFLGFEDTEPNAQVYYRREGDLIADEYDEDELSQSVWYTPDHTAAVVDNLPVEHGDEDSIWEGIGTGWFYSVLGGGHRFRPYGDNIYTRRSKEELGSFRDYLQNTRNRSAVTEDNTYSKEQRGDFVIPTVFNGNFDTLPSDFDPTGNDLPITGWSTTARNNSDISSLKQNIAGNSSFSLELSGGGNSSGGNNIVTHNGFLVPDWGVLRFDLHTPRPEDGFSEDGLLKVAIREMRDGSRWQNLTSINLAEAEDPRLSDGSLNPSRQNAVGYYDYDNGTYVDPYTHYLGYATTGFETFHLDVPDELRGKAVELSFQLSGTDSPVYIDDIFFKSKHLMLGKPESKDTANKNNDFLIERPQYSLSYNNETKNANWVAWQLNSDWFIPSDPSDSGRKERIRKGIENTPAGYINRYPVAHDTNFPNAAIPNEASYSPKDDRSYPWVADQGLPDDWIKVQGADYSHNNQIRPARLDRGHIAPLGDRDRNFKDALSTYLTTNLRPETKWNNRTVNKFLEDERRDFIKNNTDAELHIFSGSAEYIDPELVLELVPGAIRNLVEIEGKYNDDKSSFIPDLDENGRYIYKREAGSLNRVLTNYSSLSIENEDVEDRDWLINPKQISVPRFTWEIIVPTKKNTGLLNVTEDTPVTAVLIPNAVKSPDGSNIWRDRQVSIRTLESLTGYDFFSNLSQDIQDAIEVKDDADFTTFRPNLNAALRAQGYTSNLLGTKTIDVVYEPTIGHSDVRPRLTGGIDAFSTSEIDVIGSAFTVTPNHALQIGAAHVDAGKGAIRSVGTSKNSTFKSSINDVSISKTSPFQISFPQISADYHSLSQQNVLEVGALQNSAFQPRNIQETFAHVSTTHISALDVLQSSTDQSRTTQISPLQFGHRKESLSKIRTSEVNASEVPLSSLVALQQFFSSHSNYDTLSLSDFISSFNSEYSLELKIRELPGNQLAEAQLTRYDSGGRPTAGTIVIDDDASGTGWFIDPTPWESSEFSTQNTAYNLQAAEGSAAYGRYDLLTTILHELGHLAGFIEGYSGFDRHVKDGTFTYGNLTAPLSTDGSHLADPYRLLSPYLAPGVRKLPSELELQILDIIRHQSGSAPTQDDLSALQTAILTGISNGDFEQLLDQWNSRGAVQTTPFETSTVVTLTEDSPTLSQLSQTFVVPGDEAQRYLTFDLIDTTLGTTDRRPSDAFEVALLDASQQNQNS